MKPPGTSLQDVEPFNLHELPDNFEWEGHDLINFLKHPSIDLMEDDNNNNNNTNLLQIHPLSNQAPHSQHN